MSDGDGDMSGGETGALLNEAIAHLEATSAGTAGGGRSGRSGADGSTLLLGNDIMSENYWLREKLREIQSDRDRLLCEVANLRLELDMGELIRMPEDR